MSISVDLLKALRTDIDAALESVASKHGVTLKVGNASYGGDTFQFKLEGMQEGGKNADAAYYEMVAKFDKELPPLESVVKIGREFFNVVGMKSRGKNTIIINRVTDGKGFVCTVVALKNGVQPVAQVA